MDFSPEEVEDFKNDALELLEEAERSLISLEKGGNFVSTYGAVFRVFHSLKGGAGMLGMKELASHLHVLENDYQECKALTSIPAHIISYFLSGIDVSRQIMAGKKVAFDYTKFDLGKNAKPSQVSAPEGIPATVSKPAGIERVISEGSRVMVIDDESDIVDILKFLLEDAGFEVRGYVSAKEALAQVGSFRPDVVLTDYKMPDITGLEVLKAIAQIDPNLPVVYVSGHLSKEVIMESLSYGVFGAIEKPFTHGNVVTMCKNASERYRLVRLLNNSINFIYFQYSDLDQYLQAQGATKIREQMHVQFKALIEAKRKLKFVKQGTR